MVSKFYLSRSIRVTRTCGATAAQFASASLLTMAAGRYMQLERFGAEIGEEKLPISSFPN